jgi:hypothetical protein
VYSNRLVKIVNSSGNSTTSTSATRPGAVMNQPNWRSRRTISLTVAAAAVIEASSLKLNRRDAEAQRRKQGSGTQMKADEGR